VVYDFRTELNHDKTVTDTTYDRAVKKLGEEGVVSKSRDCMRSRSRTCS
jgi:hypothetical protein